MQFTDEILKELFPDLPSGPLQRYRQKATFDWRRMKLVYDNLNTLKLKHDVYKFMESHPLFQSPDATPTLDEERHITVKRMYAIYNENFIPLDKIAEDPRLFQAETEAMFMFDSSLAVKVSLTFRMFANVIRGSGRGHHYHYIEDIEKAKIGGCFALTEIAHGSNAKGMRTTATYVPEKRQYVLHSADFEAAKCWVGSLGKCATHAIVYAMLISKGKNHGLHAFVVPIRDTRTLKPYPGVIVGDLGEKIGLNGIDNGFVMFNNYHLPKEAALDKLGGVDENGDYETPFRDPNKRFGASLGILSGGRVHITSISTNYLQKAIVIAVRYSAVRRQFGPENSDEETPVLEYQQQQIRLLPYLAATYAMRIFCNWFGHAHVVMVIDSMIGVDEDSPSRGIEIHALSSAAKPLCGWTARDGIQNCREACGGHGYLKAAAIGDLRNDNDANCTYEGENSLLLQQTSNWLLNLWPKRREPGTADTPYGSIRFLANADELLVEKCSWNTVDEMIEPKNLLHAYEWITAYMLKMTYEKVAKLKSEKKDNFQAKNESQAFNAVTLSVVYGENFILRHFYKTAHEYKDNSCRTILLKLVALYGAFMLEKHLATLYIVSICVWHSYPEHRIISSTVLLSGRLQGGFFTSNQGLLLRDGILKLCSQLAPEAVALVDTLAPPDWCLKSVLGRADGEVYKHIEASVMTYPGSMTRPQWWRDVVYWQSYIQSKFLMFNNYHLPKEAALDKLGGVDENGDYETPFRDPNKRFGASLGILSGGRVHITSISTNYLQKAIVIAVRYSALRRQFGPENSDEETPVLEYQQQQIRLLPYLAATYAMRIFCNWFSHAHVVMVIDSMIGVDEDSPSRGIEIHALSSAAKPLCGWTARDGIQNRREACGGHGYLKAAAIGDLRNDNDANCTYEGENSLLLQQTSNWLLNLWPKRREPGTADTPYGSIRFLANADELLVEKCSWNTVDEMIEPKNLLHAYEWLTAYMLKMTYEKVANLKSEGKDNFQAKNESQAFNAVTLSVVYGENFILQHFYKTAHEFKDTSCRTILLKLVALYGAFILEKHLATLYIGGFFTGNQGLLLRDGILKLCSQLAPEAVALVDTLAPPDWCLKSVLGRADGEVYKHIEASVMTYPGSMTRPQWWRDVVYWQSYIQSKL